jgi:hypothetical protein
MHGHTGTNHEEQYIFNKKVRICTYRQRHTQSVVCARVLRVDSTEIGRSFRKSPFISTRKWQAEHEPDANTIGKFYRRISLEV